MHATKPASQGLLAALPWALIISGLVLVVLAGVLGDSHGFPGWALSLCGGLDMLAGIGLFFWLPTMRQAIDREDP